MGLVLTLYRGQDFFVEDKRVVVSRIKDDGSFDLTPEGGHSVNVTRDFAVELFPEVMVSASQRFDPASDAAKIVVEAPRRIGVILGSLYRNPSVKAMEQYAFGKGHKPQGRAL